MRKKVKLFFSFFLAVTFVFSLLSCNSNDTPNNEDEGKKEEEIKCLICEDEGYASKIEHAKLTDYNPTTFKKDSVNISNKTLIDGVVQNTYTYVKTNNTTSKVVVTEVDLTKASIATGTSENKTAFSSLSKICDQAKAFEDANESTNVIAAVNADFFGNGKSINACVKDSVIVKDSHNDNEIYDYKNVNADLPASMPMLFGISGETAQIAPIIKDASVKDTVQSKLFYELTLTRNNTSTVISNNVILNLYGGDNNKVNIIYKYGRDGTAFANSKLLKLKKHITDSNRIHGEIISIEEITSTTKFRSNASEYYVVIPNSLNITGIEIGDVLSYHINSSDNTWKYYDTIIGCRQALVIDGEIPSTVKLENSNGAQRTDVPRTAVGVMPNGNVAIFSVEALRYGKKSSNSDDSYGLNLPELADFMRYYGVLNGANLDGGGSTQLLNKNLSTNEFEVVVRSSDYGTYVVNNSRNVINSILVYVRENNND